MPQPTKSLSQMPAFHHYNTTCNITPKRETNYKNTNTKQISKQFSSFNKTKKMKIERKRESERVPSQRVSENVRKGYK